MIFCLFVSISTSTSDLIIVFVCCCCCCCCDVVFDGLTGDESNESNCFIASSNVPLFSCFIKGTNVFFSPDLFSIIIVPNKLAGTASLKSNK